MQNGSFWALSDEVLFLNHGSFGASPTAVLEEQSRIRDRIEKNPARFFLHDYFEEIESVRKSLAAFLGADPEGLALTTNATYGVNAALRSHRLEPGSEILITDHCYGACANAAEYLAHRRGAVVRTARVPFPVKEDDQIVEAILSAVSPRTRLALIDHVTSSTALVFPVDRISEELERRGVAVLIDGAHGPGMLDLDLDDLKASYYVGTCHKWVCAPKGAAFLYVREDLRRSVESPVVGHGLKWPQERGSRFHNLFDWPGTFDPSAILCVPHAIRLLEREVPGGWPAIRERNSELAREAGKILCEALGTEPPAPEKLLGSMVSLILPIRQGDMPPVHWLLPPLQDELSRKHRMEVAVPPWEGDRVLLRVSAQIYNEADDYRRLGEALRDIIDRLRA